MFLLTNEINTLYFYTHTKRYYNNVCTHPNHSSRGEGCRLQGVRRQKNQRRHSRRPVRRRVVANCGMLRLNFSSLFATWVNFFLRCTRALIRREGKGVREAFGSVRVAVKLNALDFVWFERGRFLRRICSRCCCVFVRARAFRWFDYIRLCVDHRKTISSFFFQYDYSFVVFSFL